MNSGYHWDPGESSQMHADDITDQGGVEVSVQVDGLVLADRDGVSDLATRHHAKTHGSPEV